MELLTLLVFNVGIVSTLIITIQKLELLSLYQAYRKLWMLRGDCFFCLGFWFSFPVTLILCSVFFTVTAEHAVLIPFVSASFIRKTIGIW